MRQSGLIRLQPYVSTSLRAFQIAVLLQIAVAVAVAVAIRLRGESQQCVLSLVCRRHGKQNLFFFLSKS